MVSHGQAVGFPVSNQRFQPLVARVAQTGLVQLGRHLGFSYVAGQTEVGRQVERPQRVVPRAGANAVIEVGRFQVQVEIGRKIGE
jgi:hypothetical protein